jgi:hypothetical protein
MAPMRVNGTQMTLAARRPCALVFSYHFAPSSEVAARRLAAFVAVLRTRELDVLVVSKFGAAGLEPRTQIDPGVFAVPVPDPPRFLLDRLVRIKRLLFGRRARGAAPEHETAPAPDDQASRLADRVLASFFSVLHAPDAQKKWSFRAARAALRVTRGRDVRIVIASGPPFSSAISAQWVARRRNAPLVVDFRDPMVEGWDDEFERPRWLARLLAHVELSVIADAAAVTCASPGIASALRSAYPQQAHKVELIMNGFDGDLQPTAISTGHRLNISFAGSLYLNRDPFAFLEALEELLAEPGIDANRIVMCFVGDCTRFRKRRLADWLRGRRCEVIVQLIPAVSAAELAPLLERATVHLNLAQHQPRQVPAKTFEHLASGREVLALCEADSDTGRLLNSIPGAIRVDPADRGALLAALRDLYRRHVVEGVSRALPAERVLAYSRGVQNQRFAALLGKIMRS